jgi:hypothetical protein
MSNSRSNVTVPKTVPPKTTLMNKRVKKPANRTGSQPSMYKNGKYPS